MDDINWGAFLCGFLAMHALLTIANHLAAIRARMEEQRKDEDQRR